MKKKKQSQIAIYEEHYCIFILIDVPVVGVAEEMTRPCFAVHVLQFLRPVKS